MADGYGDWEDESLKRRQAEAAALRQRAMSTAGGGSMVGPIYVGRNPWATFAESLTGNVMEGSATRRQAELQALREKEVQDWMSRTPSGTKEVPSWTAEQMAAGPTNEEPMGVRQAPVPPRELADLQRRHAMEGLSLKSPLAQALAVKGYTQAMEAPEKQAALEESQAMRRWEKEQTIEGRKQLERERIEAANQREKDRAEARAEQLRLAASLRPPKNEQFLTTDQGIFRVGANGKLEPAEVGGKVLTKSAGGQKTDPKVEKELRALDDLLDAAKVAEKGLGNASGVFTQVPPKVRQFFTSPQTKEADANVARLSAEQAHELYGAAFTQAERNRAASFLPEDGDKVETVKAKLAALRRIVEKKIARRRGQPDPYPDAYNDILDDTVGAPAAGGAPAAAGAPTVVREVTLKDGRIGVEYSDGTRGYK